MISQHAYCKIILCGPLNEHWGDYLGDMLLNVEVEDGQIQMTTLVGRPPDLSAYIGMLNAIVNLGLTVVATEYRQAFPLTAAAAKSAEPTHTD